MIRTEIALLLFLFFSIHAIGQQFIVSADKMNVLYIGILNPITPMVENVGCKDLVVETNNGTLTKANEPCQYYAVPDRPGITNVSIYRKMNGQKQLIGTREFRTKKIPDPMASIGGKPSGTMSWRILKVQMGVVLYMPNFDFDARFLVNSFKITVVRNQNVIFEKDCTGARFDDETLRVLQTIKAGDLFNCTNIRFSGMGHNNTLLNQSIELKVID